MTGPEILKMVERNITRNPRPMIATDAGIRAVKKIAPMAEKQQISFALAGGIAMHFYGSPGLTNDVDVIASAVLPVDPERRLHFGGARYRVQVGKIEVPVDWIVRNDQAQDFYEKTLAEAYSLPNGLPIITPEWLVILRYIAGRFRDQEDAVFLLRQKKLTNRRLIRKKIVDNFGGAAWALFAAGLKRWYDLADGKITTEKEDYEAERL
jgi:hypothetical protein